jgi:hypothetical protein
MAGLFATKLMEHLAAKGSDPTYDIGRANFDAVQDVTIASDPQNKRPYGPRALVFTLVGNGAVRACVPPMQLDAR